MTLTQPEATTSVPYTSTATTERTVSIIGTAETPAPGLANDKNAKISENNLAQNHQYIYNMQMLIFIPYIKLAWWHIGPRWVAWGHLLSVFKGHVRPFFLLVMKFLLNTLAVLLLELFGVYQVIGPNPILDFITKSVKVRITKWFRKLSDRAFGDRAGFWKSKNKGECSTGQSCGLFTNIFTGNPIHSCTNCIPSGLKEQKMILTCPPGDSTSCARTF